MSDEAITSIVTGIVTICTMLFGFLSMWARLRHGEQKTKQVEEKIDGNTLITSEVKDRAEAVDRKLNGGLTAALENAVQPLFKELQQHSAQDERNFAETGKTLADHASRLATLEVQTNALKTAVEGATREVTSTRHEMRGHLQTLTNKLDLLAAMKKESAP